MRTGIANHVIHLLLAALKHDEPTGYDNAFRIGQNAAKIPHPIHPAVQTDAGFLADVQRQRLDRCGRNIRRVGHHRINTAPHRLKPLSLHEMDAAAEPVPPHVFHGGA